MCQMKGQILGQGKDVELEVIGHWKDLDWLGELTVDEVAEVCMIKSHPDPGTLVISSCQITVSILALWS